MIIGITGTTSGIGKSILDLPYEFVTFDRNDGDIEQPDVVFEKLKDCDVFINNAWHNDCQTKLLNFFFERWRDYDKKIISIGSSGVTDTKLVASRDCNKLDANDVADMIKFILEHKVYIPEIYFYVE